MREGDPAYFDLILGDGRRWADPHDREREAAWDEWRDRILARWQRPGWRPAAWSTFDLPELMDRVKPWRRDALERWNDPADKDRPLSIAELIHGLASTSDEERGAIEDDWRKAIDLIAENPTLADEFDVPPWFMASEAVAG